jgi:hypothetical protein
MTRGRLIPSVLLLAVIPAVGFVTTDSALAAEQLGGMQVISSDATARFMPLTINKAVVIEVPGDIKDVLVADPIVKVVMLTSRRAYIRGQALGQTNVYFYDAARRQIEALDVTVQDYPVPATFSRGPENVVTVYRGPGRENPTPGTWSSFSCTPTNDLSEGAACYARENSSASLDSLPSGSSVTMPAGGGR